MLLKHQQLQMYNIAELIKSTVAEERLINNVNIADMER
jgi:hypothetical protein